MTCVYIYIYIYIYIIVCYSISYCIIFIIAIPQVRPYKPEDCTLFSGCLYASGARLRNSVHATTLPDPPHPGEKHGVY